MASCKFLAEASASQHPNQTAPWHPPSLQDRPESPERLVSSISDRPQRGFPDLRNQDHAGKVQRGWFGLDRLIPLLDINRLLASMTFRPILVWLTYQSNHGCRHGRPAPSWTLVESLNYCALKMRLWYLYSSCWKHPVRQGDSK